MWCFICFSLFSVNLKLKKQCLKALSNVQANGFIMTKMFQWSFRFNANLYLALAHSFNLTHELAFKEQYVPDVDNFMIISK